MKPGAAVAEHGIVNHIPIDLIDESTTNPRKAFRGIELLAGDFKLHGVLQPILLRQIGDRYGLIDGARRYRAAKVAKLETLPALIRDMTDAEVLEAQLVSFGQREDLSELEEAEGFERLEKEFNYTVDEIAAKVGKSKRTIYARKQLLVLGEPAREALRGGKLEYSMALLLATKVHDPKRQEKALREITEDKYGNGAMSYRQAAQHIQQNYCLHLFDAPFDTTDKALVPEAGACGPCPKRTGTQGALFDDAVSDKDLCTDSVCYGKKKAAAWEAQKAKAAAKGAMVLEGKAAKEVFARADVRPDSEYLDLDAACADDPKGRTFRQLLGRKVNSIELAVAKNPETGQAHELVPRDLARETLKAAGHKWANKKPTPPPAPLQQEIENKVDAEIMAAVVAKAEKKQPDKAFWRLLFDIVNEPWSRQEYERRGFESRGAFDKAVNKMNEAQLRGLVVETLANQRGGVDERAVLEWAGVDAKKIRAEVKKQVEAAHKKAEEPAGKKAARG